MLRPFNKVWLIVLAFLPIVFFQNCGPSGNDSNQGADPLGSIQSRGNGDGYTGKFTIDAPSSMTPGETIEINVYGGTSPFQLSSNIADGRLQQLSERKFSFTVPSSKGSGLVNLSARDSLGAEASTDVLILGVNRWFFQSLSKVSSDGQNSIYIADEVARDFYHLNSQGDIIEHRNLNSSDQNRFPSIDKTWLVDLEISGLDEAYMATLEISDGIIKENKIYVLNKFKRHLLILDRNGELSKKVVLNGVGLGLTHSLGQIASLNENEILVTDPHRKNILIYDNEGNFLRHIGSNNYLKSAFHQPRSVAFSGDGQIYALDSGNKRLQIFNENGDHLRSVDSRQLAGGAWWNPQSLSLSSELLIVANTSRNRVQAYNLETLELIHDLGPELNLNKPRAAIVRNETIYIADSNSNRIVICERFQNCQVIDSPSNGSPLFKYPIDVEIHDDKIYVLDRNLSKIQILSLSGQWLGSLSFETLGGLSQPHGFTIQPGGDIFVADTGNHRVIKYSTETNQESIVAGENSQSNIQLSRPESVSTQNGKLVISDTGNHRIIFMNLDPQ